LHPPNTIIVVKKPLYGIPEAGTHWWSTYYKHHRDKLGIITSTYNPCLLITSGASISFGIVAIQTDDTLIASNIEFYDLKENGLRKANLRAKPKEQLTPGSSLTFNRCVITL
jgi:hypothetical protein